VAGLSIFIILLNNKPTPNLNSIVNILKIFIAIKVIVVNYINRKLLRRGASGKL